MKLTFFELQSLLLVNDRAGQNRARPNRAGSVDFTEGSAEPQWKIAKFLVKFSKKFGIPKRYVTFLELQFQINFWDKLMISFTKWHKHEIDKIGTILIL